MKILSAYIMQKILFRDRDTYNQYLQKVYNTNKDYQVVSAKEDPETKEVLVIIRRQYNNNPLEGGME